MNPAFEEVRAAVAGARRVLVASHVRPDGDALGCTIAFALHLQRLGKEVLACNEDGLPGKFHYLPHGNIVVQPPAEPSRFDAVVALDTSTRDRLGTCLQAFTADSPLINIDHHVSNERYGAVNCVDPTAPATGQILVEYFQHFGDPMDGGIAENLFAAISTDTGSFQYRGTDARTFAAASALVKTGVDVSELSRMMYDSQPRRRLDLLRHALNSARFTCDDQLVSFALTLEDAGKLGVFPEDNEGIIDHLRSVEGVVAAVFFEELADRKVRVSARSKDMRVDVCEICRQFGGGGHPLAAGARIEGNIHEVSARVLEALCHAIRNRD